MKKFDYDKLKNGAQGFCISQGIAESYELREDCDAAAEQILANCTMYSGGWMTYVLACDFLEGVTFEEAHTEINRRFDIVKSNNSEGIQEPWIQHFKRWQGMYAFREKCGRIQKELVGRFEAITLEREQAIKRVPHDNRADGGVRDTLRRRAASYAYGELTEDIAKLPENVTDRITKLKEFTPD